ncbi:PilZ domain-containing protein [Shinella daejeonensis]|uniref:PilZ domain-containing protein n=1 Tax=Shinella daejeonensis TaxID=659017 RepID=UPI0020C7B220|nr:PilZ domain-containing protein [Shinella daejeonensis]MCP8897504.1 PilZ domain-containing protein [Shinella daejeonensis]
MRRERAASRSKVRLYGTVRVMRQSSPMRVVDLSQQGMALDIERPLQVTPGQTVEVVTEELGTIEGIVCWYVNGRMGLRYRMTSRAAAQVVSYFRFFHRAATPVLRG